MRPTIFLYGAGVAVCAFACAWADELVSPRLDAGAPGIDRPQAAPLQIASLQTVGPTPTAPVGPPAVPVSTSPAPDTLREIQASQAPPRQVMDWRTGLMFLSRSGQSTLQAIDRATEGLDDAVRMRPTAALVAGPPAEQLRPIQVGYARNWPAAVSVKAGRYDLEFSPHASVTMTGTSREAEAGGVIRLGRAANPDERRPLVRRGRDQATVGSSRWYLFASISGRAIGWRTVRQAGGSQRTWWSPFDNSSAFVSSSQAGVAWNVGQIQTSLAFVRRRSKTGGGPQVFPSNESIVAFTIRLRPKG